MNKERITTGQAKKIAGVEARTIRDWIHANKIIAYKVRGWFWEVDKLSLLKFIGKNI